MRDNFETLQSLNVTVLGVSTQGAESHQAFIDKYDLPFALVVDEGGEIAGAFEVPLNNGIASRQSVLIGEDGTLLEVWRSVSPAEHADQVIAAAKAAG